LQELRVAQSFESSELRALLMVSSRKSQREQMLRQPALVSKDVIEVLGADLFRGRQRFALEDREPVDKRLKYSAPTGPRPTSADCNAPADARRAAHDMQ